MAENHERGNSMSEVTKQDLIDMEARIDARLEARLEAMRDGLIEAMRRMQTELLRGFEAFSAGQTIRLRKVEADQSNLDTALSSRVSIVESRLHEIELRLGGIPGKN
jgi:hypothetical protein